LRFIFTLFERIVRNHLHICWLCFSLTHANEKF
jgi:hypothetical protein